MLANYMQEHPSESSLEGKMLPAIVVNNNDPDKLQKIQYRIAVLHQNIQDSDLPWAMPCMSTPQGFTPGVGSYGVPLIGTPILVFETEDDDNHGYYVGDYQNTNCKISEFLTDYPFCYGWADSAANLFIINTKTNTINLIQGQTGANIGIDNQGGITMFSPAYIKMKAPNIELDGNVQMGSSVNSGLAAIKRTVPTPQTFANQTNY